MRAPEAEPVELPPGTLPVTGLSNRPARVVAAATDGPVWVAGEALLAKRQSPAGRARQPA